MARHIVSRETSAPERDYQLLWGSTPFGGFKLQAFGGRDKSLHAHDQYRMEHPSSTQRARRAATRRRFPPRPEPER
ncbi:MAG: hypothetical protein E5X75_28435 [Mesorhizobium sp.]|nr:MAG: hypothetical protein E5X75_28435 [Mesorhizobium sp.]